MNFLFSNQFSGGGIETGKKFETKNQIKENEKKNKTEEPEFPKEKKT